MLWLASRSPRRRELLQQIAVPHQVLDIEIDESIRQGETPEAYVQRMAIDKCNEGWNKLVGTHRIEDHLVLAADTSVVLEGRILGKPESGREAAEMLECLSGRTHQVYSAIALKDHSTVRSSLSVSSVSFGPLLREQIDAYVETGEPMDKAGSYGIQGLGGSFVQRLEGSYSGVVGLPLFETVKLLSAAGLKV
jgi:septum formation protein